MRLFAFLPLIFGVHGGDICEKIRLRENSPYGYRVNFNTDKEELPERTKTRLRNKGNCDEEDFADLVARLEAKNLGLVKCRFPLPNNNDKTKDIMYVKCAKVETARGESGKHDEIEGKAQKLKCRNDDFVLGKLERKCIKLRKKKNKKEKQKTKKEKENNKENKNED